MKTTRKIRPLTLLFSHHAALASLCCLLIGLTGPSGVAMAQNPVPLINQPLVPDAAVAGGKEFTLTVNGTEFVSGSVVHWNGKARATTFVSTSRLKTTILSSDISKAGTASVVVVNPMPGGGTSNPVFLGITYPNFPVVLATPANYGGDLYTSVAVADFNGDGILDLALADWDAEALGVMLGNGDGTFKAVVNYSAGLDPESVVVGDFNNDGKLDIAEANAFSNNVSVFLGNGDGTFRAAVNYDVGSAPYYVGVGDFNRDGNLDLVVANNGNNTIEVLLGNGDGTFQMMSTYPVSKNPVSIVVGDFNGDGKLDLAVANSQSDSVSILLGNGDGTFQPAVEYGVGSGPSGVITADFNGDGKLDLAFANGGSGVSTILFGNGDGTFQSPLEYPVAVSAESIAAGDFNGDGRIDLGFSGFFAVSILLQSTAQFSPTKLDFGVHLVGSRSQIQQVKLTNIGPSKLIISSIALTGTDSHDFHEDSNCGSRVLPGGHCTIGVSFKPTEGGPRTAAITVTDSSPDSPQSVPVNGIGLARGPNATLLPNSLDFGSVPVGHQSSPQQTKLRNYGTEVLHITNIKMTGTDQGDFSQQNNCPRHLLSLTSCIISVTFTPPKKGSFGADVSVYDNAPVSPQQVGLSGTGCVIINHHCKGADQGLDRSTAKSALARSDTATAPSPSGSSRVGTRVVRLVDATHNDPYLANGRKRELLVRFWYPASLEQGCVPAEYTSPKVWSYFSTLMGIPALKVEANSCLDAPIADGVHPVVVFTPGYTGTFTDYTFLLEDLASRGYVVASVDHTYEATAVEFPDGRLVRGVLGSHLDNTWRLDDKALSFAVSVRAGDLKFVVDELERLSVVSDDPFAGKLDMSRIALMGHSLGGLAALSGLQQERRFGAGILLDGELADESVTGTDRAVLILAMGRTQWREDECKLWSNLSGTRLAVNFKGAEHITPTDAVWLAKGAIRTSAMGPDKTIAAVRDYIAAFLDANLQGRTAAPLLTGPSSAYPDAAVTTQKQLLCGEAKDH
jgi:dienelactone hydrolase